MSRACLSSSNFSSALSAAHEAASAQHYPQGALYVVATPIGNLADVTLRALHVLRLVDTIACEDTRHSQALLRCYGLERPSAQMLALHQHNEAQAAHSVLERLRAGERVAYVSDAGTPGVSDPGARLVAAVRAAGMPVLPIAGASSVTAALSVAGAVAHTPEAQGFVFVGFLSTKASERTSAIAALAQEPRCVVLLEAPHRILPLAQALGGLGTRAVTLGRELTKQFEDITTQEAQGLAAWLAAQPQRTRGEFVVVLHPREGGAQSDAVQHEGERVLRLLLAELPVKTAVRLAADITGASRNVLYETALALKNAAQSRPCLSPDLPIPP